MLPDKCRYVEGWAREDSYRAESQVCLKPFAVREAITHLVLFAFLSVCYNFEDHPVYRKDGPLRGSRTLTEEKINWVTKPPAQLMFQDRAVWYEPEVSDERTSLCGAILIAYYPALGPLGRGLMPSVRCGH